MKILNNKTSEVLELPDEMSAPEVNNALASYNGQEYIKDYKPNFYDRTIAPMFKSAGIDIKDAQSTPILSTSDFLLNVGLDVGKQYVDKYGKGDWGKAVVGWDNFFLGMYKPVENILPGKMAKATWHEAFVGPNEADIEARTAGFKDNPPGPAGDFIESLGTLAPSLMTDIASGGVIKEYLLGRAALSEATIRAVPYLNRVAGWIYGSTARTFTQKAVGGDVLGGVAEASETAAWNMLFASSGTGWKSIVKMIGIGESEAYYNAAKESRLPTVEEINKSSSHAAALGTIFAGMHIFEKMTTPDQQAIISKYNKDLAEAIKSRDLENVTLVYNTLLNDKSVSQEIKDSIANTYNTAQEEYISSRTTDSNSLSRSLALGKVLEMSGYSHDARRYSISELSKIVEDNIRINSPIAADNVVKNAANDHVANKASEIVEPILTAHKDMKDTLMSVGMPEHQAEHNARIYSAMIRQIAKREGRPVQEVHEEKMPEIFKARGVAGEGAMKQGSAKGGEIDPFKFQDTNQEKIIHSEWKAASPRYDLEGSGDIFRELAKENNDKGYISEKVRRIDRFIEGHEKGTLHPDDSIKKAIIEDNDKVKSLIDLWNKQPVTSPEQQVAKDLNIALLKNDMKTARAKLEQIKLLKPTNDFKLKLSPKEDGNEVYKQTDFTNISRKISNLSDKIPQAEGAGKIPNEVTNEHTDVEMAAEDFLSMIFSNPDRFPVEGGSPIIGNIDYGPVFTPDSVCAKGKALKVQVVTMRKALEDYLPEPKGKDAEAIKKSNAEIRTAANRKLVEAGIAQGLETPCLQCYEFEKQITGFNAKPLSIGTRIYKTGSLEQHADFLKKTGILRGYGVGDFQSADIASLIRMGYDLANMKVGYGQYTKNLNLLEIFGDTGFKFNISSGKTTDIGLPVSIAHEYAQRYPNAGVVYIAINNADLMQALKDPRVHNIIPVHLGGGTPKEWLSRVSRLDFENFQKDQSEKVMYKGKKKLLHSIVDPEYVKAMDIVKKGASTGDAKKYLDAIDKASKLVGTQIVPKFAEYFKATKENGYRELEKVNGYKKLIGVYGAEYGKTADIPKIDMSKMNIEKARAYMETPNRDISSDANLYASMARSLIKTALSDGVEGINAVDAMRLKQRASGVGKPRPRGWIEISKDPAVRDKIFLAANKNASTFQHELAHWYLNDLFKASKKGLVDLDYGILRDWLKIRDNQTQLTVQQHEQFARGWERYLREGKAPSSALVDTFARFKTWLTKIYGDIRQLKVPLSDDVRGVMDRMLSDENSPLHEVAKDSELTNDLINSVSNDFKEPSVSDRIRSSALGGAGVVEGSRTKEPIKTSSEESPAKTPRVANEELAPGEVVKPSEGKASETVAPQPIENIKGKEKPSKSFNDILKRHEELFYHGPVTYTEMNRAEDVARGMKLVEEQPEYGRRVAMGIDAPPPGVTAASISLAYSAKMKAEGNTSEWYKTERALSLRATRQGQEISTLAGRLDENAPEHFINQVLDVQLKIVSKRLFDNKKIGSPKQQLMDSIDDYAKRLKEAVDSGKSGMKSVEDILKLFQQDTSLEDIAKLRKSLKGADIKTYEDFVSDKLGLTLKPEELNTILTKSRELQALSDSVENDILNSGEYWEKRNEMQEYIQSLTPTHALKVWTSVSARGAMLMSFKSPITNIVSNTVMAAVTALERRLGENWYTGLNNDYAMKYVAAVNGIYQKSGYDISRMDTSWVGEMRLGEEITHSQGPGFSRRVGQIYEDIVFKQLMGAPDVAFSSAAFADSANLASSEIATRGEGLTGQTARDRALEIFKDASKITPITPEGQLVRAQAIADARYATYTNSGPYSKFSMDIRNALNKWTGDVRLGDQVMPFVKTPANVVQAAIDFSGIPVAVEIFKIPYAMEELGKGNKKPIREIVDACIKGGIGTVLTAILVGAVNPEDFRGEYDVAEGSIGRLKNAPANSIKIGGKWISLDYLGPLGANFVGMMYAKKYGKTFLEKLGYYGKGAGKQLLKVPGAREFSDLYEGLKSDLSTSDFKKMGIGLFDTALNYARSRVIPGIVGDVAKAFDKYERRTTTSGISQAQASIPGLRQKLPIRIDPTSGEAVRGEGVFSSLAFGSRVKTAIDNDVIKEITRLSDAGTSPSISSVEKYSPRVKELRNQIGEEAFQDALQLFSDTYSSKVADLINTSSYQDSSDEDKVKEINSVRNKSIKLMLREFNYEKPEEK